MSVPQGSPTEASVPAKAAANDVPEKNPPTYSMPVTQQAMSTSTGSTRSTTRPFGEVTISASSLRRSPEVKRSPLSRAFISCSFIGP